ncbi:MAG: glycosyltransferase, partial [Nitrosotalea sp.]
MKILVVSSYLPYPLFSGGQVRLYNLLKELSARHEITLVCEIRSHQSKEDVKELEKICKQVITVPRKKQWSMSNVIKSASSHKSFLSTGHTLSEMKEKLTEVMSTEKFDVIHVETFYVMQNLPKTSLPVVLVEHNIEYTVYEKFRNRAPAPFRSLLALDIKKIKYEEERLWREASALVAVSNEDKRVMEKEGRHPFLVSNGVNTDQFFYKNIKKSFAQKEKKILFIGDFTWIQNQD